MRILFVGDAFCIHTARWIRQLAGTGWDLHVFDPLNGLVHDDLTGVHLHTGWKKPSVPTGTRVSYRWPFLRGRDFMERRLPSLWGHVLSPPGARLARLVERLRPDCIHTFGLQHHGEAVSEARALLGGKLPAPWIYSCRGSDIYFYRHEPDRLPAIEAVLRACDYYMCNCTRDLRLAEEHGFRGEFLGHFQGGGGFPVEEMRTHAQLGRASGRRTLAIKGLETRFGRGLLTIEALRLCARELQGYELVFYQAQPEVRDAAFRFGKDTGLSVEVLPRTHYRDIWQLFGRSRLSIGISRSDGVPNTMIESMIMGALPIQTDPGGASAEWIEDGVDGLLVPHDDSKRIAQAVVLGLSHDELVDRAAKVNAQRVFERADTAAVQKRALEAYVRVAERHGRDQAGQRHSG